MVTRESIEARMAEARTKRQLYERLVREADARGRPDDYKLAMEAAIAYAAIQESAVAMLFNAQFGSLKSVK